MRLSKLESTFLVAILRYLRAKDDDPVAVERLREVKSIPAVKIDRLCEKISSGEKEIVYLEIQAGVAVFSATPGVALVHADFDSLQADPNCLPELVIGSDKKKEIVRQVDDGLERLRSLRPAASSDKDIRRLSKQLRRLAGVPSRPQQPNPKPAPKAAAEPRPIRFTTLLNAPPRPAPAAQPLPA